MSVCADDVFTVSRFVPAPAPPPRCVVTVPAAPTQTVAMPTPRQEFARAPKQELYQAGVEAIFEAAREGHFVPAAMIFQLKQFVSALPQDMPVAEAHVTDVGSLCFDWDVDPNHQLSIFLKGGKKVAFALFVSGAKLHGSANMAADKLDSSLSFAISSWLQAEKLARATRKARAGLERKG